MKFNIDSRVTQLLQLNILNITIVCEHVHVFEKGKYQKDTGTQLRNINNNNKMQKNEIEKIYKTTTKSNKYLND
jgi:hypothetical protein